MLESAGEIFPLGYISIICTRFNILDETNPSFKKLKGGIKTFYAGSRAEWRKWLPDNHLSEKSIWLILYNEDSKISRG